MYNSSFFANKVGRKLKVTLNQPKRFLGMAKAATVFTIRPFLSSQATLAFMAGAGKRRGQGIYDLINSDIVSIEDMTDKIAKKKELKSADENLIILKKKLHPNAFNDIRNQIAPGVCDDFLYKPRYKNITSIFEPWQREDEMKRLKEAFDSGIAYHFRKASNSRSMNVGRDLTINVHPQADGSVRAQFNSEYPGCGNGDYWLLINPTTAIYYERD